MKPRWGSLWGIGAVYNCPSRPTYRDDLGEFRYVLRAGMFTEHLAAVRKGEEEVRLLIDHDFAREWASTRDDSLIVIDGPSLYWRVNVATPRGRQAIARYAKLNPLYVHCSVGMATAVTPVDDPDLVACPRWEAKVAKLREISICSGPAITQTRVFFTPPAGMKAAAPKSSVRPSTPRLHMSTPPGLNDTDLAALRLIARFGARGLLRDVRGRLYQAGLIDGYARLTPKGRGILGSGGYAPMLCTGGSHVRRPALCA